MKVNVVIAHVSTECHVSVEQIMNVGWLGFRILNNVPSNKILSHKKTIKFNTFFKQIFRYKRESLSIQVGLKQFKLTTLVTKGTFHKPL